MPYEVLLNSISNEVWAIGRRSTVIGYNLGDPRSYADAITRAQAELGRVDFVVRVDLVLNARPIERHLSRKGQGGCAGVEGRLVGRRLTGARLRSTPRAPGRS
jgi:hypothetical protein